MANPAGLPKGQTDAVAGAARDFAAERATDDAAAAAVVERSDAPAVPRPTSRKRAAGGMRKPASERYVRAAIGFPPDVLATLKVEAKAAGLPLSAAVVLAVGEWVERRQRRRAM